MNTDPSYQRLLEISWQRELTAAEQAELRRWLASHPEAEAEWQADSALNALLDQAPSATVPSNFTSRVLQAVELGQRQAAARRRSGWMWTRPWTWKWLPRVAFGLTLLGAGLFAYEQVKRAERLEYAHSLATVSEVPALPDAKTLEDFDAIQALSQSTPADQELLTLFK